MICSRHTSTLQSQNKILLLCNPLKVLCQTLLVHQGCIAQVHIDIVPVIADNTTWKALLQVSDDFINVLVAQFVDQPLDPLPLRHWRLQDSRAPTAAMSRCMRLQDSRAPTAAMSRCMRFQDSRAPTLQAWNLLRRCLLPEMRVQPRRKIGLGSSDFQLEFLAVFLQLSDCHALKRRNGFLRRQRADNFADKLT